MPRADTTLVRIDDAANDRLVATARRLGVSKASLLAGVAAWLEAQRGGDLPADLLESINDAASDAGQRHADGSYRGSLARGAQITTNGGPRKR